MLREMGLFSLMPLAKASSPLLAAYKVLNIGLIFSSNVLSSVSFGAVGSKSSMQIFLDFLFVAIFVAVLFYFIKTKQKAMIITSLIGLVSHMALWLISALNPTLCVGEYKRGYRHP